MYRVTAQAPEWVINSGKARRGDVDTQLVETKEEADELAADLRASGLRVTVKHSTPNNDLEMYTRMWR